MNIKNIIKKSTFYNIILLTTFLSLIYIFDYFCNIIIFKQFSAYNFFINFIKIEIIMVVPITIISCIILLIFYKKTLSIAENKNNLDFLKKISKNIFSLKLTIIILNLIGFMIGFLIYSLILNNLKNIFSQYYLFYLLFIITSSFICSIIQINLNNVNLTQFMSFLNLNYIDKKSNLNFSLKFKNQLIIFLIIIYLLSFSAHIQINQVRQNNLYSALLQDTIKNKITNTKVSNILISKSNEKNRHTKSEIKIINIDNNITFLFFGLSFILLSSICLLCMYTNNKDFKNQLINIKKTMENLLNGNAKFTERIRILDINELGHLSHLFNNFMDTFKDILDNIFSNTGSVHEVSDSLDKSLLNASSAIEEMASSVEQITGNTNKQIEIVRKIRGKIEEMLVGIEGTFKDIIQLSSFVDETSSAMHESAESIKSVTKNTEKVTELANKLVEISKKGSDSVFSTINAIKDIENASNDVMEIVDIITNLSSQTDLLAMNAAIEAAHAGEKGKGFAVVADEIRNLAENSKDNASMIIKHIKDMNEKVKNGVILSNESGQAFKTIDQDINLTTQLIKEVSCAIQEQNIATNEILNSIDSMLTATMEMKEITDDMKIQSEDIHKLMVNLSDVTMEINTATGEQNKGNVEILSLISTVKEASSKNITMVDNLHEIINTFQIEN